jgi:hypothetical protein
MLERIIELSDNQLRLYGVSQVPQQTSACARGLQPSDDNRPRRLKN